MKTWLTFLLTLGLLAALPVQAVTPQLLPPGKYVTLNAPGLYDIATANPGASITIAANGIGLTGKNNWLSVGINAGITLTLKDAYIDSSNFYPVPMAAITAGGKNCGLILVGDNTVISGDSRAGVNVPDTASLVIDGPGKLTARGEPRRKGGGAGIGGSQAESSGLITIRNAVIVAAGYGGGAGIGGGSGGHGSAIAIANASVTASGSMGGAGIGAGLWGNGSSIAITASAVRATGDDNRLGTSGGAGIGGGLTSDRHAQGPDGDDIEITIDAISVVQAIGGKGWCSGGGGGAGIGGGGGTSSKGVDGGSAIRINIGAALAKGSGGGVGCIDTYGGGGKGALCGRGGGDSIVTACKSAVSCGKGKNGQEIGNCTVDRSKDIDLALAKRPNPAYAGNSRSGYPPYPSRPVITADSENAVLTADGDARFQVKARGGMGTLAYQWQVSISGGAWADIVDDDIYSGATTGTLTLTSAAITDSGKQFRCVVNDAIWQEVASSAATLMPPRSFADNPTVLPYMGLSFYYGDWELACDNTRTCRAAGYSSEGDEFPLSVLLTRNAGPNEPVTGQLMIGQYGENPFLDSLPDAFKLSLRINGKAVGQIAISSRSADLASDQVTKLLAALVRKSRIEFALTDKNKDQDNKIVWRLSDSGAAAVLLKMDEYQGRFGTPGALVKKGKKGEAGVFPPLPVPVVKVAPFHKPLPGDEHFVEENRAALLEAIGATESEDGAASYLPEPEEEGAEITATRLTKTKMLLSTGCWLAAYNAGCAYWVINSTPPWQPVLVTDIGGGYAGNDISRGVISSSLKGRGLGDCWSSNEWTWDGEQFVHTQSSTTGMCRLIAPGGAWALPTIVTEVRQ
ncbi:MAG: DUF1176 domain-containing protein [Proteobacteria bacterium]|nr:DUF1176 domain-containing protein [Pseudomonadota bacterium]